jgi:hypothetical protein
VPKEKVVDMILSGKRPPHAPESLHTREVYVVKKDGADEKEIENKIKNTQRNIEREHPVGKPICLCIRFIRRSGGRKLANRIG